IATLVAAIASLVALVVAFVPLERAFPARRGQPVLRPELATDLAFFFGQYLAFTGASIALLLALRGALASRLPPLLGAAPLAARLVAAVVLGDLSVYAFHRACHRFTWLWRFHAVHHSAEHLDWLAAHREHPVDGLLTQLAQNLPAFLLAVPPEALAGLAAFRGMWAVFVHSNVRVPLGPLRWVLGAPELHRFHHARRARTEHNFANLAPWIDVVFGTHHLPDEDDAYELGLVEPLPKGYLRMLAAPLAPAAARSSPARAIRT
ncbi:MAG TPA: sterol desaturase family protein, partial [Minicystis sp.]|nr:sterol desaturase family protein [Minicystis sp.]